MNQFYLHIVFFEFNLDICVNALSEKGSSRVLGNT